jgi:hypothetical protein
LTRLPTAPTAPRFPLLNLRRRIRRDWTLASLVCPAAVLARLFEVSFGATFPREDGNIALLRIGQTGNRTRGDFHSADAVLASVADVDHTGVIVTVPFFPDVRPVKKMLSVSYAVWPLEYVSLSSQTKVVITPPGAFA